MKAVILDAASLGKDIDLSLIEAQVTELQVFQSTTPEELPQRITDVDIIITNKVVIDAAAMAAAPNLKLICVLATGINNIDVAAAQQRNILVKNVTAYGTASVAQHTLMMMLALATKQPQQQHALTAGKWEQAPMFVMLDYPIMQLAGKTLVIFGHGELGQAIEKLALALGMHVKIAARPGATNDSRPSFESLLPEADVISFHCPLTDTTRDLLNAQRLKLCKSSVLIVNNARGGIVNEADAVAALRAGQIGGLAADVLTQEPPRAGNPLLEALRDEQPLNLVVSPHIAWTSPEARQNIVRLTAENIAHLAS